MLPLIPLGLEGFLSFHQKSWISNMFYFVKHCRNNAEEEQVCIFIFVLSEIVQQGHHLLLVNPPLHNPVLKLRHLTEDKQLLSSSTLCVPWRRPQHWCSRCIRRRRSPPVCPHRQRPGRRGGRRCLRCRWRGPRCRRTPSIALYYISLYLGWEI